MSMKYAGFAAVVALVMFAVAGMLVMASVAQQNVIFVKLMQCPTTGAVSHMPGNWPQFETVEDARQYADAQLDSGAYRIAYVHEEVPLTFGTRSEIRWLRATGDCYGGLYQQWTPGAEIPGL